MHKITPCGRGCIKTASTAAQPHLVVGVDEVPALGAAQREQVGQQAEEVVNLHAHKDRDARFLPGSFFSSDSKALRSQGTKLTFMCET